MKGLFDSNVCAANPEKTKRITMLPEANLIELKLDLLNDFIDHLERNNKYKNKANRPDSPSIRR